MLKTSNFLDFNMERRYICVKDQKSCSFVGNILCNLLREYDKVERSCGNTGRDRL